MSVAHVVIDMGHQAQASSQWWQTLLVPALGLVSTGASVLIAYRALNVARLTAGDGHRDRLLARRDQIKDAMGDTLKLHAAAYRTRQMLLSLTSDDYDRLRASALFEIGDLSAKPHWPTNAFLAQVDLRRIIVDYKFSVERDERVAYIDTVVASLKAQCDELEAQVNIATTAIDAFDKRPKRLAIIG